MLQQDEPDDYVVVHRRDPLGARVLRAGVRPRRARLRGLRRQDERFFRPAEVDLLVGDSTKARDDARLEAQDRLRRAGDMMVDADLDCSSAKLRTADRGRR